MLSFLSGMFYSWLADMILFSTCDVLSLIVQAFGGGLASSAVSNGTDPEKVPAVAGLFVTWRLMLIFRAVT